MRGRGDCGEDLERGSPVIAEMSHAAKGDMVIGAMPMPAETSDTARLRCVSNQPVTQAIIGDE